MNSSDRMRVERLLSEMGMNRKLKLYRNNDARVNAAAFGFNTIGLTGGVLAAVSDEIGRASCRERVLRLV